MKNALSTRRGSAQAGESMIDATPQKSPSGILFQGILFVVLGTLAIIFPLIATVAIEQVFAALLLIAGGYSFAIALGRKNLRLAQRVISGLWAALTLITGLLLAFAIVAGMKMLTILLGAYFAAQGIMTIFGALKFKGTKALGILILSGIVSLVLAFMIFSGFPGTAGWALGLLLGINLIFTGGSFIWTSTVLKSDHSSNS